MTTLDDLKSGTSMCCGAPLYEGDICSDCMEPSGNEEEEEMKKQDCICCKGYKAEIVDHCLACIGIYHHKPTQEKQDCPLKGRMGQCSVEGECFHNNPIR